MTALIGTRRAADGDDMDLGTALITLAVGAIAVLPRVPALSSAGRRRADIRHDGELWAAMPHGTVRDRLGAEIERRTDDLMRERARDKTLENGWIYGTAWAAVGWVSLVVSTAVTGEETWGRYVRDGLQILGLSTGIVGVFILGLVGALAAWKTARRVRSWFRSLHGRTAPTYDI